MKLNNESNESIVRRFRDSERGQAMVLITIALVSILGAAAIVIDIGRLYHAYQELLSATQAAALAGASVLSNDTASEAIATATSYSAANGDLNAASNLTNATMVAGYPQVKCLTSIGIPCSESPAGANAVVVREQATVGTTFARVFGVNSWPISATATASGRGGFNSPYNVVIVLDTTQSMNDTDSDSQCGSSRISCALTGIRTLLGTLSPCPLGQASCGAASGETPTVGANVTTPVDEVGLMVFPGLTSTSQVPNDYTCPTSNPAITSYNNSPVYQIIALSSDYRASDAASSLNASSDIVIAAGGGSCSGVSAPGGEGTFYAGVINAAQAQLVASARPNTKNVMILLSDGDATASPSQMAGSATSYPATQECHQAVTAAQNAAAAGTTIYSVAYGAEASGCPTDTSPAITPCQTMQQIASSPSNFFSDYTATGGTSSCVSASRPTSNLNQIFTQIAEDLTVARLIPNNTL
jgi:Flp pilus assembly protein TadG